MLLADDSLDSCVLDAGAIWIHGDDPGPDAVEPSASAEAGTAEDTAAGHIPNAQQAQPADMVPEASDSVQGAPSEVRRIRSRHMLCRPCEGHVS